MDPMGLNYCPIIFPPLAALRPSYTSTLNGRITGSCSCCSPTCCTLGHVCCVCFGIKINKSAFETLVTNQSSQHVALQKVRYSANYCTTPPKVFNRHFLLYLPLQVLNFPKTQELHGLVLWCDSDPNILSQCDVLRGSGLEVQHFQSPEAWEEKKEVGSI